MVGRDLRADTRIAYPLIPRAHLLMRLYQGKCLAIDNDSLDGTFTNGRHVPMVNIDGEQSINIGNPDEPVLKFEMGRLVWG
ncbi:FHA domain-containing protein [Mycobacterium lepromatosis]|uniref:FHA domain-containing protein n=1 Tax=Mycobacterium lepromatosis TaxID=480418 RepID=UPI003D07E86E